jgi:5-methylcytosine-specific restriction protein A
VRTEFSAKIKILAFERSGGHCESCSAKLFPGNVEFDHVNPDGLTGTATLDNCAAVCRACHKTKTKRDVANIARAKRRERKHIGIRKPSKFACSRGSRFKKKVGSGEVVLRRP